ncbi:MAG TPA: hypothetical protein VK791_00420 [bacterium]|jgi:DNA-binding beta-propeller fold protein YncE|nr:hypothetical protein [bacterium]
MKNAIYICLIGWGLTANLGAVTQMEYFNSLVAGVSESGYRDGSFIKAYFNNPSGLAFDETGDKLYVADAGNNRIRVINTAHQNDVDTLTGTGASGAVDGPLEKATFASPELIVTLPENRLAVYDGANLIRLIDLKTRVVSTLTHGLVLWNMVYRPQDDSIYFSQPDSKSLSKIDLKTATISPVLTNNPKLLAPMALCIAGDKFYVSDKATSNVFEMILPEGKSAAHQEVELKQVGKGDNVIELAYTDNALYALQAGKLSLVKINSSGSTPVQLATFWGFYAEDSHGGVEPFMDLRANIFYGFTASPKEPRKFFISKVNIEANAVVSVKDYSFDKSWIVSDSDNRKGELSDFNYPEKKIAGTYRVLIMGDSRTSDAIREKEDVGDKAEEGAGTYRVDTFPKQLEFFLNSEAALRDVPTHFEVLTLSRPNKTFSSYVEDEVTPLVKRYDVDLVLGLASEADVKKGELDSTISSLGLLSKAMRSFKISSGAAPKLAFVYVPSPVFKNDITEPLWKDLCDKGNLNFIDLTEPFDDLKTSYYPTAQKGTIPAYTAYGSELIANILSGYLENNQVVPFEAVKK